MALRLAISPTSSAIVVTDTIGLPVGMIVHTAKGSVGTGAIERIATGFRWVGRGGSEGTVRALTWWASCCSKPPTAFTLGYYLQEAAEPVECFSDADPCGEYWTITLERTREDLEK